MKFDFLGLKTLTVIDIAERLINGRPDRKGERFSVGTLPLNDAPTFALLQSGETTGVFQLESSGMQKLFKQLRPDQFNDIVAAVALYRPGPLGTGMVKDYVDCKHGKPISTLHRLVDDIVKPTYGVIVYQEQVMQIAQQLAGYTLGGADLLRRAMGKKKPEEMAKQKSTFLDGSVANGVVREEAEKIFELLEFFAGYGFNKSHSAAYALLTYQTAYLKAHFPVEFLCALLTADRDKTEKVVRIIAEGRAWGVEILPPEVNESNIDFTVVYAADGKPKKVGQAPRNTRRSRLKDALEPRIRFGLGAVRGVGDMALEAVLDARQKGPFADLFDLAERVDAKKLNRGVLEALIYGGAFDASLKVRGLSRPRAVASVERALERGKSVARDRECGQTNLFGLIAAPASSGNAKPTTNDYVEAEPWDLRELLRREKEALGFYVSGHPLDRYGGELKRFEVVPTRDLPSMDDWAKVRVAGTVENYRERIFKGGGGKVAFFILEDLSGGIEVKVRENQIERFGELLVRGEPVLVNGKLQFPRGEEEGGEIERIPTLLLDDATALADAIRAETRGVQIRLRAAEISRRHIERLEQVLRASPGTCPVQLVIQTEDGDAVLAVSKELRVEPNDALLASLERVFGMNVAELR